MTLTQSRQSAAPRITQQPPRAYACTRKGGFWRMRLVATCFACVLFALLFAPGAAAADGTAPVQIVPTGVEDAVGSGASNVQSGPTISGWQGSKNYRDSFSITVSGGSGSEAVRFLSCNCSISPATGKSGDSFTVTVNGAGAYSLTAIMSDGAAGEISQSVSGTAGKADQAPLSISGWGNARDYYRTFSIQVAGGTTQGNISFSTDGCAVSPATGPAGSVFVVTVTRVGTYSLTAIMSGNSNFKDAYSTEHTGMSGKADQASIMVEGWQDAAYYGDSFPVKIAGGSTSEALTLSPAGCEVVRDSGNRYTVTITSVGPYTLTAKRAGNYGYNDESAYVCGIAKRAPQPSVSVNGWVESKNVTDSFPIRISGGMTGGTVHFATCGCSINPATGTADTNFVVTVRSVGEYSLTAFVDGDDNHLSSASRELKGNAGKAVQPNLEVSNWNDSAGQGNSFDVEIKGGGGTGSMDLTTNDGCVAVLKRGETSVYTVTVTAGNGEPYTMRISKSGDANYGEAASKTMSGVAGRPAQSALSINGWRDSCESGGEFAISIAGGSGDGELAFDAVGCEVAAHNDDGDVYEVYVTAQEGESYSLSVSRAGGGRYAETSALRSGSVRRAELHPQRLENVHETETPLLDDGFDIWILVGMLLILLVLVAIALVLQQQQKQRSRRYR